MSEIDFTQLNARFTRRQAVALGVTAFASVALFGLAGCSSEAPAPAPTSGDSGSSAGSAASAPAQGSPLDKQAYDALIAKGGKASDDAIAKSTWASQVKSYGKLRVGTTRTSQLFSQLDETDNVVRGFDAGIFSLLARYILGDEKQIELVQVDSSTRETVLTTNQVDAVFATYSITPKRQEVISFAGPYYTSRQGILVKNSNSEITGLDSLAGKTVATQAGSTGPQVLAQYAPQATVQEFSTDQEARTALEQGRVDAYVTDHTLLLNAIAKNAGAYKIAGDPFGNEDPYGIGLPKDSDGVAFVNEFLKSIEKDGSWTELWKLCIGNRTGVEKAPDAPEITTK